MADGALVHIVFGMVLVFLVCFFLTMKHPPMDRVVFEKPLPIHGDTPLGVPNEVIMGLFNVLEKEDNEEPRPSASDTPSYDDVIGCLRHLCRQATQKSFSGLAYHPGQILHATRTVDDQGKTTVVMTCTVYEEKHAITVRFVVKCVLTLPIAPPTFVDMRFDPFHSRKDAHEPRRVSKIPTGCPYELDLRQYRI